MKKSKGLPEGYLVLGVILVVALLGLSLVWFGGSQVATGQAVLSKTVATKELTSTKSTTLQKEPTTYKEPALQKSSSLNKESLLIDKKSLSKSTSPFTPPVSSLPQPAPGDQNSDIEGVSCTTCGKQYEYKSGMVHCDRFEPVFAEWGLNVGCGNRFAGANMVAWCMYGGRVVNYGGKCNDGTYIERLAPPFYALQSGSSESGEQWAEDPTEWHDLPGISTIELECSQRGGSEQIYLTCMREKR